jgi:hypothetical protein
MLVGYGLVSGALIILAVTTPIPLSCLMICLATVSMTAPLHTAAMAWWKIDLDCVGSGLANRRRS